MSTSDSTILDNLKSYLTIGGIDAPDNTTVSSDKLAVDLTVRRLFGIEISTPSVVTATLIVRQVEETSDPYIASLPAGHERAQEFMETRLSGILADIFVHSIARSHLIVARRSLVQIQNPDGTLIMSFKNSTRLALGKINPKAQADADRLLSFDTADTVPTRTLYHPSEMEYSEPGMLGMIYKALMS